MERHPKTGQGMHAYVRSPPPAATMPFLFIFSRPSIFYTPFHTVLIIFCFPFTTFPSCFMSPSCPQSSSIFTIIFCFCCFSSRSLHTNISIHMPCWPCVAARKRRIFFPSVPGHGFSQSEVSGSCPVSTVPVSSSLQSSVYGVRQVCSVKGEQWRCVKARVCEVCVWRRQENASPSVMSCFRGRPAWSREIEEKKFSA